MKKTKLLAIKDSEDPPLWVRGEPIEKVTSFKYLGSIMACTGYCDKDIATGIGMAKKRMLELTNIWKDRAIPNKLKVKLMKTLACTLKMYGAEGWTLRKSDEKKIRGTEMWFYRRLLRVSWTQKRTNRSILEELGEKRQLLELVIRRKFIYFGYAYQHQESGLMKLMFQVKV